MSKSIEKICKFCGQPFKTTRSYKEFCSRQHYQKYTADQIKSLHYADPKPKKAKKATDSHVVKCEGCIYYQLTSINLRIWCCHYCIETGDLRGILPKDCYKKQNTPYTPKAQNHPVKDDKSKGNK